jgi:ubiquinone/menaquinone biosynthesis C-methylase UbiE
MESRRAMNELTVMSVPHPPLSKPPAFAGSYLMEAAGEGTRLEGKTSAAVAEAQLRGAGLAPGMTALDVGCGSGAVTRVMSGIIGGPGAMGLDASVDRIDLARKLAAEKGSSARFVQGQADALPFPDGSFDFAWSRFLFEYLDSPQAVLREMQRVVRPGGVVVVADLDHQLQTFQPLSEELGAQLGEALEWLRAHGFDPDVGRKLHPWFHAAGFEEVRVQVLMHQVYAGPMPEADLANWTQKLAVSTARLARLTGETGRWQRLAEAMHRLFRQPDFIYYAPLIVVRGVVPRALSAR